MNTPDPTKQFMARVVAWPQDGEATAYVNVHYTFMPNIALRPGQKLPWMGMACRSVGELAKVVSNCNTQTSTKDVYFCTSTQSYAEEKISQRGYKYLKAVRNADNAVKMKAIFLDCDLSEGKADKSKGYETVADFAAAFKQFIKDTGLPKPTMMVSSGGGFHIYWTLMDALPVEEWAVLAYALAEAAKRHNFKCDTACTIDSARVLRIPGTKNYKYDPPRPVTLLGKPVDYDYANAKIEAVLEPYKVAVPFSMSNPAMSILPARAPLNTPSDLSAGIDMSSYAPINLDSVVLECGFVAEALATGGANFSNPLWNLTTLLATFTEGGEVDAHRMAAGHPSYGPGETAELYERKLGEKIVKNMGWPRCAAISASGSAACQVCPHLVDGKSPLNFAPRPHQTVPVIGGFSSVAQAAQAAAQGTTNTVTSHSNAAPATLVPGTGKQDPDLPSGYLRNANGLVLYAHNSDDGTTTWLPVTHYPMIDPWLQRDPWTINFTTETEFGRMSTISVPLADIGSSEMKKNLQAQGFMVLGGQHGLYNLTGFIMAWITKLQSTKDAIITSVPFGWLVRGGKVEGFAYGGRLHHPTGTDVAVNTDPELARQFAPTGDRMPWIAAAQLISDQRRPALDAIIASAFGAPLVRFTGHAGLLMSAYSVESGIGKSTALKIAQAVWGDPVKGIQSLSDTQNSVLNKMGELRSLPMYWDELKSDDDSKKFVDTVFRLTLGKEKSRMSSKIAQRTPGTWQTVLVSASNESLLDAIAAKTRATTAGIFRIFEYTVKPANANTPGQIDPTVAQRVVSKLHDNYGVIGLEYASYLGTHHALVEHDAAVMLSNVSKETGMQPDERFWIALIATTLLGAHYSNALGYTTIDEAGLKHFMYQTLKEMRAIRVALPVDMRDTGNVVNVLAQFLNENRARNTLMTNIIYRRRGACPAGAVSVIGDASRLDALHVHIGRDDRLMRIGQSYLYSWLAKNNFPRHVFLRALQDQLSATVTSGRLGTGTPFASASEYIIEFDIGNTAFTHYLDEV